MSNYFNQLPDFEYVSRLPDAKISDYIKVKNLFKKGELRPDIFQNVSFFTKYKIKGDDRPDNVAFNVYQDSNLDWLILTCNNIINIQSEWPLTQVEFDSYMIDKYETYEKLNSTHHYETVEHRNSDRTIIVPSGLQVESSFSVDYFDYYTQSQVTATPVVPVTNYEYENKIEEDKRNIFILKEDYLGIVEDDMTEMMAYKKGSTQYKSETLKTADNIRLFQ